MPVSFAYALGTAIAFIGLANALGGLAITTLRLRMMRGSFYATLAPLFILYTISFASADLLFITSMSDLPMVVFFIAEALLAMWLFRAHVRTVESLVPEIPTALVLPASFTPWIGVICLAIVIYFASYSTLVLSSSRSVTGKGSSIVIGGQGVLVLSAILQVFFIILHSSVFFLAGFILFFVSAMLLLNPPIVVVIGNAT